MTKISIIVPVFNVEKMLPHCLDSIKAKTFSDFECLLIDDGSTDNSGILCDEYVAFDPRFKVIHSENQGASAARNLGLDNASGEWIQFIDSDDWIAPDFLQNYFNIGNGYDIVFQGITIEKNGKLQELTINSHSGENTIETISRFEQNNVLGWCINKIFINALIQKYHIRFPKGITIREDLIFTLSYLQYVSAIGITPKCDYHYVIRDGSLMSRPRSYREVDECCELIFKLRRNLVEVNFNNQYKNWFEEEYVMRKLIQLKYIYYPQTIVSRDERYSFLKSARGYKLKNIKLPKTDRVIFYLFHSLLPFFIKDRLIKIVALTYYKSHYKKK